MPSDFHALYVYKAVFPLQRHTHTVTDANDHPTHLPAQIISKVSIVLQ